MGSFDYAIKVILKHEGGWVDDPKDPGGETNFGISMLIIKREGITAQELGLPNFDPGCMKLLTKENATKVYKRVFWDRYDYGSFNADIVATKIFDCAVNCGPKRAHVMAQKAANRLDKGLNVDGVLGPISRVGINSCDPQQFADAMVTEMELYYTKISDARPSLKKFLPGWLKRAKWTGLPGQF